MKTTLRLFPFLLCVLMISCLKQKKETVLDSNSVINIEDSITNSHPPEKLSDIYTTKKKASQNFTFKATDEISITCKEGTKIKIEPNSLVSTKTGKPSTKDISLQITEYYKISDMLLANLSTTSNGKLLETGGMLNIEAYADKQKLKLKNGRNIEIHFPNRKKNDGMLLFNGTKNNEGINWIVNKTKGKFKKEDISSFSFKTDYISPWRGEYDFKPGIFTRADKIKDLPRIEENSTNGLYKHFAKHTKKPTKKGKLNHLVGQFDFRFIIDKDGNVERNSFQKNTNEYLIMKTDFPDVIHDAFLKLPKFIPARTKDGNVRTRVYCRAKITIDKRVDVKMLSHSDHINLYKEMDENNIPEDQPDPKKIKEQLAQDINTVKVGEIQNSLLKSSKLNWINCDRFLSSNKKLTNFKIKTSTNTEVKMMLVFKNINSIFNSDLLSSSKQGSIINGVFTINNMPIDEAVTIIILKNENKKNYIAIKDTKITVTGESGFKFEPVTLDKLKKMYIKMNR